MTGLPASVSFAKAVASGAEARRGPVGVDGLGRVDADDPDLLDAARQLDVDRVAVDDLDDGPGEELGRRRWADGARVGESDGAIVGDGETSAGRGRTGGRGGFGGGGRVRSRPAARGDDEDDDGAGREQADLVA